MYSYLYLRLAKTSCFSFYRLSFFFFKIGEQEGGTGFGGGTAGRGKVAGKVGRRINTVQKMGTHVYKCKNVETVPGIGVGG
jgi:hypothetical protein